MMKVFETFLVLVFFCGVCLSQKPDETKLSVVWSPEPNCHQNNSDEVKALKPRCSAVQIEAMTFRIVDLGDVSYAMTHRPVRDYLVASVQISNKTNSPMEVISKRSRLARFKSADEYTANAKAEFAAAQTRDELRQASYREGEIGEKEGGIRSGLKVRDKYEVDYNRGRIVRRPGAAIDEPEAPPTESPMPSRITSELLVPKVVFDNILKSKTLASGEKAAGHLVFKNLSADKPYVVLYLNAGQFEFVFPALPN